METEKVYRTLEFDKILTRTQEYAIMEETREAIRKLQPETTLFDVRKKLTKTEEATISHQSNCL